MNVKLAVLLLLSLCMLSANAAVAGADTSVLLPSVALTERSVTLHPVADNYPDSKYPDSAYGKTSFLYVGNSYDQGQDIWGSERIYILFNISDLPRDYVILQATLRLWQYYAPASEQTYEAHRVLSSWEEEMQSWNNQPTWDAEKTSEAVAPPRSEVAVEWDLTTDVKAWYTGQLRNYGTMIKVAEEGHVRDASSGFWSREYPVEDWQPKLTILLQSTSPPEYVAKVGVRGLPTGVSSNITLDGSFYSSISSGSDEVIPFDEGGVHMIAATGIISSSPDTRYRCEDNATQVSEEGIYVFNYVLEYMVTFSTEPSELFETQPSGWYANGTILEVERLGEVLVVTAPLTRLAFDGWYLNSRKIEEPPGCQTCPGSRTTAIIVSQGLEVEAEYRTEYYLNVTSPLGRTEGSGWYPKGSNAHFSLDVTEVPAEGISGWLGSKRVFVVWVGSENLLGLPEGREGAVAMREPTSVEAVWEDDQSTIILNLAILSVLSGIVAVLIFLRRFYLRQRH